MKKINDKTFNDNKANALLQKLNERLARDERIYRHSREVYAYRKNGEYFDNLLLLETFTKEVHGEVFKSWYSTFSDADKKRYAGIEVVHVGTYNKITMRLNTSKVHKVVFKGE